MLDGLYAAASGMEAQQTRMDAIGNDVANISTTGYQAERVGFRDLLYTSGGASSGTGLATGAGTAAAVVGRNQSQGEINPTGRPLDVAIQGEGYLQVRRPDGTTGLTRNGALQTDAQGRLTTSTGMLLEPPITIPAGVDASRITIGGDGTVTAPGGRQLGRIALVTVPAPDQLLSAGDTTFTATAASGAIRAAAGSTLRQGALESSNVDLASSMSELIDAQQSYSMASKAIQFQDQMLEIANQVKR
jgi:flagellar basal-body rod protein FlgG